MQTGESKFGTVESFRQTTPSTYVQKKGGGALAVFGSPFFLAGAWMLLEGVGLLPAHRGAGDENASSMMLVLMGAVFSLVGGIMVFGRQWLVIALDRRLLLRQTGLGLPIWTRTWSLEIFNSVVISHDPGDSESGESYPVRLRARDGKDAAIAKPADFGKSMATAEFLARILNLPLTDQTTGKPTVIEPRHLGESLPQRLSGSPVPPVPARPLNLQCRIEESEDSLRIVIPPRPANAIDKMGIILPVGLMLVMIVMWLVTVAPHAPIRTRLPVLFIELFLFALPAVFFVVRLLVKKKRGTITLTASPSGLLIERQSGSARTTMIPADDLLDIDFSTRDQVVASAQRSMTTATNRERQISPRVSALLRMIPNPGIIVKSRAALVPLGEGLASDELEYVVALLVKALLGRRSVSFRN